MIIVPQSWTIRPFSRTAVVAWGGTRAATRSLQARSSPCVHPGSGTRSFCDSHASRCDRPSRSWRSTSPWIYFSVHKTEEVKAWLTKNLRVLPLHPDRFLVAEPERALLRRAHAVPDPAGGCDQRRGSDRAHRSVREEPKSTAEALRRDRICPADPRQGRQVETDLGDATL